MSRVILDVNCAGTDWFSKALQALSKKKTVRFAYSRSAKYQIELQGIESLQTFFSNMAKLGRVDVIEKAQAEKIESELKICEAWISCHQYCDDPHIFAMVYLMPSKYILTEDKRIAGCRRCINGKVEKEFCMFRIINSQAIFDRHKGKMTA